ncbi:Testis-specific chromodomain Y 1 [Fusarium albosuccineum]|uniref:Testis-specific chromodomain Y 1 n=1 Tax=Fusarium albosuccineum TaxID=1237068 RepID=A0A8H4LBJ2_9HYPO|nr:Testis-specific chromodomain Y 1 [Fusarium albosuccineum]
MPPTKKPPTVFTARDKPLPFEEDESPLPSIEDDDKDDDDSLPVESDIAKGDESNKSGSPTVAKKSTRSSKHSLSQSSDEESTKTVEAPIKRQRRSRKDATTTPRRSERISTAATTTTTNEEPLVPKARAKRGRGRPSIKGKVSSRGTQKEWEVEKIVGSQIDAVTSEHFYLVKWKGFASKENTWEPKKNLGNCRSLITAFEKQMAKKC